MALASRSTVAHNRGALFASGCRKADAQIPERYYRAERRAYLSV